MESLRSTNLRRAAAACAAAVVATWLLPPPAAGQTGRSLPAPPGSRDAAFRLAEPRVAPLPEAQWSAEQRAVAEKYARTGDAGNALATMLRIPELAESVHGFLDYASRASTLPARDREILILRVAWLARNGYLWADHAAAADAAGLTAADRSRIAAGPDAAEWGAFDATLLRLADELFRNSSVTDATWNALSARYGLLERVDAVMTVAEFTTLSMLFNSLGVQPDAAAAEHLPAGVPYRLTAAAREPALTRPRIEPGEGPGLRVTRTIARHPAVAAAWRGNTNYVNRLSPLTPHDRELLILRIGWNCQAEYEWAKHVGSVGRARDHGLEPRRIAEGPDAPGWAPHEVALLEAADELYRHAIVSDATWRTLSSTYDTHELASIVMTVATYRFVSMTLNAFGVQLQPDDEGFPALAAPLSGLVRLLDQDQVAFGVTVDARADPVALAANDDIDFVFFDLEHGPYDVSALRTWMQWLLDPGAIAAAGDAQAGKAVIVRIPASGRELDQNTWQVKQVLDTGAHGVIFPTIETPEQALMAVRAMRYPQPAGAADAEPAGLRGTNPRLAARYWGLSYQDYVERADVWRLDPANGNLLPWILIESPRGVANVREIARALSERNVGAVLFAGSETGGDMLTTHGGDREAVARAIDAVLAAGKEFGLPVAMTSTANMMQRIEQGARLFTGGVTSALRRQAGR